LLLRKENEFYKNSLKNPDIYQVEYEKVKTEFEKYKNETEEKFKESFKEQFKELNNHLSEFRKNASNEINKLKNEKEQNLLKIERLTEYNKSARREIVKLRQYIGKLKENQEHVKNILEKKISPIKNIEEDDVNLE